MNQFYPYSYLRGSFPQLDSNHSIANFRDSVEFLRYLSCLAFAYQALALLILMVLDMEVCPLVLYTVPEELYPLEGSLTLELQFLLLPHFASFQTINLLSPNKPP